MFGYTMQFIPFTSALLLGLISASLFLSAGTRAFSNRMLGSLLALMSLQMVGLTMRFSQNFSDAYAINSVLATMLGPTVYVYVKTLVRQNQSLSKTDLVHAVPVVTLAALVASAWVQGTQVDILILSSLATYSVLTVYLYWSEVRTISQNIKPSAHTFIKLCIIFIIMLTSMDFLIFYEAKTTTGENIPFILIMVALLFSATSICAAWVFLTRPAFISWIFSRKYAAPNQNLTYTANEHQEVLKKLDHLIENEKIHMEPGLNLDLLADRMGVPKRLVSTAINQAFQKSVRRFINDLRIEVAQSELESTDKPVLTIMYDVGFETKSNFNREFYKVVGCSPKEYREKTRQNRD